MTKLPTLVLRPSKIRLLKLLLMGLAFASMGYFMGKATHSWLMYACAVFFGLAVVIFFVQMLTGSGSLILDAEGFTLTSLQKPLRVPWDQIAWLGMITVSRNEMAAFRLKPGHKIMGSRMSRKFAGVDGSFANQYQQDPHQVLALLIRYSGWVPPKEPRPAKPGRHQAK